MLVRIRSNTLGRCWTNGEPGQAQITLPKSTPENCSVSVNCSCEEKAPKMHSVPAGIEWWYTNRYMDIWVLHFNCEVALAKVRMLNNIFYTQQKPIPVLRHPLCT